MTREEVKTKRATYEEKILTAEKHLELLQEACTHPKAKKINRGSSGNIMTGRDPSYWRECTCPDCGKQWEEPQS